MDPTLILRTGETHDIQSRRSEQESSLDSLLGQDFGRYHIDSVLGTGGMGQVFLAHHRDLHRPCALKILRPDLAAEDPDYVSRFMEEGRAAASLVHPNIVTVHACGKIDGLNYLEMEFVPGRSMRHLIADAHRLSPEKATLLTTLVADGLAAAHRNHIVHRDLKPDNVLMTLQGVPKIGDFGLAKRLRHESPTSIEGLCGTPGYMAPELFRGDPPSECSDVYALGVTYFYALSGKHPFPAETVTRMMDLALHVDPPDIREIVPDIQPMMVECLSRLMHKDPAVRIPNAIEAAKVLRSVLDRNRNLGDLVSGAFHEEPRVTVSRAGANFSCRVLLPDGRTQVVIVEESDATTAEPLVTLYSVCGPSDPQFFESALRLTPQMAHGAVGLRELDGKTFFVAQNTYPAATADVDEIRQSVYTLAFHADRLEQLLTGRDDH
jgi:serine/threonine-protein kinase